MERERERERKERRGRGRRGRGKGGREGRGSKDAIGRSDRDRKARKPTDASKLKMQFSDSRSKTYQSHSTKKSCAFFLGVLYRGSSIRLLQSGGCPQAIYKVPDVDRGHGNLCDVAQLLHCQLSTPILFWKSLTLRGLSTQS